MHCRLNRRWRYEHETPSQQDVAVRGGASPLTFAAPTGFRSGNDYLRQLADEYVRKNMHEFGLPHYQETPRQPLNHKLGYMTADHFDQMQHNPQDPAVQAAYRALGKETTAQFNHLLQNGFKMEPWLQPGQPYQNSKEMAQDVAGKHIWYFPTINPNEPASFGDAGADLDPNNNLLLQKTGHNINGHELTVNDAFRAVHDIYGHAKDGFEFGPEGEYNAFMQHRKMFSPLAQRALATETHGQNSWVNFGHHLRGVNGLVAQKGQEGYIHPMARPYAAQKMALLHENIVPPHPYLPPPEIKLNVPAKKLKFQRIKDSLKLANAIRKGAVRPKIGNYNPNLFSGDIKAVQMHYHALTRKTEETWDSNRDVMARAFGEIVKRAPSNYKTPIKNELSSSLNSMVVGSPYEKPDVLSYEVAAAMMHDERYRKFAEFADQAARRVMGLSSFDPHQSFTHANGMGVFGNYDNPTPEPSLATVFHQPVSALQLQKMAAEIGHRANQISVLNFNVHPEGDQQLFHARVKTHDRRQPLSPQLIASIGKVLFGKFQKHGIEGGTLLPDKTGHTDVLYYNYDPAAQGQAKHNFVNMINELPTENDAGPRFWPGTGMLVGDMDFGAVDAQRRKQAHEIYHQTAAKTVADLPEPKAVAPTRLQRIREKLKLMTSNDRLLRELRDAGLTWVHSPEQNNLMVNNVIPDLLEEANISHPAGIHQKELWNWYWNKGIPAVQGTEYPDIPVGYTGYSELDRNALEGENSPSSIFANSVRKGQNALLDFNPYVEQKDKPFERTNSALPLLSTAMLRGLNTPRFKGPIFDAIIKHAPEFAKKVHKLITAHEARALGLITHEDMGDILSPSYNKDELFGDHKLENIFTSLGNREGHSGYYNQVRIAELAARAEGDKGTAPMHTGYYGWPTRKNVAPTGGEIRKVRHHVGLATNNLANSAKNTFNPDPKQDTPQQMSRNGMLMQLARDTPHTPEELREIIHGWLDNPNDMAYSMQIIPDYLQEMGHPSENLFNWYWNKVIPEVNGIKQVLPGSGAYENFNEGIKQFNDGIQYTPKSPSPTGLLGTSLIRALNLPVTKGSLLDAVSKVYGANSRQAYVFNRHLLGKELHSLGLLPEVQERPTTKFSGDIGSKLLDNLDAITEQKGSVNDAHSNAVTYNYRLTHGHFDPNDPARNIFTAMPITDNDVSSLSDSNKRIKTIGNVAGRIGRSAKKEFGIQPEQLSMLQFGQHAPAGSGAVVRGVYYAPGKMMPTLETAPQPQAPKVPSVQQPMQPQKPAVPDAPPVVPMTTTVQPAKAPNATPFLDRARGFIKRKNVRLG